uniref:Myb/SANT-like domain-containing protein n=1 Tax=Aegilops tauschii TaxID=37682 RepID=M8BHL1_AEGTA
MDNVEVTAASGNSEKSGVMVWTTSMTNTMLGFLADLVAKGKRTSSGFRETHLKQCAVVLNEQFKLAITFDQVRNHLKKWRKIWVRVVNLKNLSGAIWDEDTCTIRLSEEHYAGHCMENGEINTSPQVGESSHPKGPPKNKAKVVKVLEDPLGAILKYGFKLVAEALVKSGGDDDDIPDDLWDVVSSLKEFDEEHLAHYYAYLVDNPKTARDFMKLSETNKSV